METAPLIWLRADYHLPALYSCRVPLTSNTSARTLPAPGPATIRLALIRTGIEVFGRSFVESVLFPLIRALPLHIRPPERVALSPQILRVSKVEKNSSSEAPISREMAHAEDSISIYTQVPLPMQDDFRQLLQMIGYWGQACSLACCTCIEKSPPPLCVSSRTLAPSFQASFLSSEKRRSHGTRSCLLLEMVLPILCVWISLSGR